MEPETCSKCGIDLGLFLRLQTFVYYKNFVLVSNMPDERFKSLTYREKLILELFASLLPTQPEINQLTIGYGNIIRKLNGDPCPWCEKIGENGRQLIKELYDIYSYFHPLTPLAEYPSLCETEEEFVAKLGLTWRDY